MSVVILGMEIPTVCIQGDWYGNCPMDRLWCAQRFAPKGMTMGQISEEQQDKLPDWCPLRPLPNVHGDLIDRDAARGSIKPWSPEDERNGCTFATVKKLLNTMLDHAPTIVESEGY